MSKSHKQLSKQVNYFSKLKYSIKFFFSWKEYKNYAKFSPKLIFHKIPGLVGCDTGEWIKCIPYVFLHELGNASVQSIIGYQFLAKEHYALKGSADMHPYLNISECSTVASQKL